MPVPRPGTRSILAGLADVAQPHGARCQQAQDKPLERGVGGLGREPAPRGGEGAAAGESVSLGQDKTYPLAPRDTPGCGGNGVTPKRGQAGGVHGCRQGPGKGQIQALVLLAADDPGSVRAAEAAGLPTWVLVQMCSGWEAAGAASLGFSTSDGSPGLSLQLARRGKSCRTRANPVLGKKSLQSRVRVQP